MAYSSDESGSNEIYVQPFPEGGARYRVSTDGGIEPIWQTDGQALLYRSGTAVLAVEILAGDDFRMGTRQTLFEDRYQITGNGKNWDVDPTGQTFVLIAGEESSGRITVTVNALNERR